jgi:hypothetical protein
MQATLSTAPGAPPEAAGVPDPVPGPGRVILRLSPAA